MGWWRLQQRRLPRKAPRVLWLEVAHDNDAALALYLRAGFETAGRRPGYYARGQGEYADALVMRRLLNTAGA